ncbi:MAG: aldo/keto reductase [Opitutales bacterium]
MLTLTSTRKLRDGYEMPLFGLGVFQLEANGECERQVRTALDLGYRHIDTARGYRNEEEVGNAIRASGIPREEIFVTTKVMVGPDEKIETAVDESMNLLNIGYIDLYLLHWPKREHTERSWEILQKRRDAGLIRSIGVSNFTKRRFEEQFLPRVNEVPAVNQIERHPFYQQRDTVDFGEGNHIFTVAYSPLARGNRMDNLTIAEIADAHGKSNAQVMIRYQLQSGCGVIPKSAKLERLKENADVFDFELSHEQMRRLDGLEAGESVIEWRPEEDWF